MPRQRKDYIVLDSVDAIVSTTGVASFHIQPHMYPSWRPRDEMTMRLITVTLNSPEELATLTDDVNQGIKYYGNIAPINQYNNDGRALLGATATRSMMDGTDFTVMGSVINADNSPELDCGRLNNIKFTAELEGVIQTTVDLNSATFTLMFEIKYYSQDD